jgi:indole-3-glycerol phosphate synthase
LEIAALDAQALRHAAEQSPTPRDFLAAIQRRRFGTHPSLIAELKRASPSKGILAPHLDLFQVADIYTQNGAAAISVLTDEKFFQGKLETLHDLRFTHHHHCPYLAKISSSTNPKSTKPAPTEPTPSSSSPPHCPMTNILPTFTPAP